MTYIIDGHNLIPKISGIDLSDTDDEIQLIKVLQDFCRLKRKKAIVYFDQAPPGMSGVKNYGSVRAHFVREGRTADDAIMEKLRKLAKRARNVTVVSSDRQVQRAARAAHAEVMSSNVFAKEWQNLISEEPSLDPRNRTLSDQELIEWEAMFKKGCDQEENKYNK